MYIKIKMDDGYVVVSPVNFKSDVKIKIKEIIYLNFLISRLYHIIHCLSIEFKF